MFTISSKPILAATLAALSIFISSAGSHAVAQRTAGDSKKNHSKTAAPRRAAVLPSPSSTAKSTSSMEVTPQYCQFVLNRVDELVRKEFYDEKIASTKWPQILQRHKDKILASTDLISLDDNVNAAIKELNTSHCQFLTINDETYYFIHTLFHYFNRKLAAPKMDFTGAVTGGVNASKNQVRYVVDGSPAQAAGVKVGDIIVSVNGQPYVGQSSFFGTAGKATKLVIKRDEKELEITVTPAWKDAAQAYAEGIGKSVRIIDTPAGKIGYIHVWSGGSQSHDAFEEQLSSAKLQDTRGLIYDIRDGYGGNSFEDLDMFYRPAAGYPAFQMWDRKGKRPAESMFYDKPGVTLINGGSRSGKELVAYSLKGSGRSTLVGERTAGAVVAGRLFPIDHRTSLYLAVAGGTLNSKDVLEGCGVPPDVEVVQTLAERGKSDAQFETALKLLQEKILNRAK